MQTVNVDSFNVVGISVRTSNVTGTALQDIQGLWDTFMSEQIMEKIPDKVNSDIYAIYTDYEGDHLEPYTMVLGCRVSNLDQVPEGMVTSTIQAGGYNQYTPKGDLTQGLVYNQWLQIWEAGLNRRYQTDFEIYGEKAMNPQDAEVDIFIGLK